MAKELTGQEVISELVTRLRTRFTTSQFKEVYKDKPVQGMVLPCIFVESVNTVSTAQIGRYAMWDHSVDVRCHPPKMKNDIQTWARGVAVMVIEAISRIQVSGQQVKATRMEWRVVDDVLHVTARYSYRVLQTGDVIPDMQTLTYGQKIKE